METILEVKGLKTYYYTQKRVVPAADDVNFTVQRGEVVGLVGESGCGKSTVARSLVGLIDKGYTRIEAGEVLFDGKDLTKASKKELCAIRGKKISMIFQDPFVSLSPVYTVGDQIFEVMKAHAGFSADQVTALHAEYEIEHGVPQYDVEFRHGYWEYNYEIHADTGDILSYSKDD